MVLDAEEVSNLVQDGETNFVLQLALAMAGLQQRSSIDRYFVRQQHPVRGAALSNRGALVEPQRATLGHDLFGWVILNDHGNIVEEALETRRNLVARVPHQAPKTPASAANALCAIRSPLESPVHSLLPGRSRKQRQDQADDERQCEEREDDSLCSATDHHATPFGTTPTYTTISYH